MPDLRFEHYWKNETKPNAIIAGVDEAGRGPLAGPVFAGAVIIDQDHIIPGINDTKKLSENTRERLYEQIIAHYQYGIGTASVEEIDSINILEATKLACQRAIENLPQEADIILIDGNMKFPYKNYVSIVRGDQLSLSIAAGSIIAKVSRDRLMRQLSVEFPLYCWERNKGYGTKQHIASTIKHGKTIHHRLSFNIT